MNTFTSLDAMAAYALALHEVHDLHDPHVISDLATPDATFTTLAHEMDDTLDFLSTTRRTP